MNMKETRSFSLTRLLPAASLALAMILMPALPAHAQPSKSTTASTSSTAGSATQPATKGKSATAAAGPNSQVPCLPQQQDLPKIPELISSGGKLRATITVVSEQNRIGTRNPPQATAGTATQPGDPKSFQACFPTWVRAFRSPDADPPYPAAKPGVLLDPMNGPTLRARVGELIELTFLNNVNPANFGASIDLGDQGECDQTSAGYPGLDVHPNCFHGSTTANLHFHGTHTNPNTTGDNVFLELLSSQRLKGNPPVTPADVKPYFDEFFAKCEAQLALGSHREWPRKWADLPPDWTAKQQVDLTKFDDQKVGYPLWPVNQGLIDSGNWPQYFIGSYPYCFKLPQYPDPPTAPAAVPMNHAAMNMGGAGSAQTDGSAASTSLNPVNLQTPLKMGQAPGTHWYHAHKHGSTAINVNNGMTGAFIIEGQYDDELNDDYKQYGPWFTRKVPVMVISQYGGNSNLKSGGGPDKGPDFSVNGRMNPRINMKPGEIQMWRIVNASARAGTLFLGPPAGFHWRQLAQDGVQFKSVNYVGSQDKGFLLAAGNRADLLVQAPATCPAAGCAPGIIQVNNEVDPGELIADPANPAAGPFKISLMTVKVSGTAISPAMAWAPAPTFPPFLNDIEDDEVKGWQTIDFTTVAQNFGATPPKYAVHKINGTQFDGEVGVTVRMNKVEEWKITNSTPNISHPFHIHINPFQVVEVFEPNALQADGSPLYVTDPAKAGNNAPPCYLNPNDNKTWKPCMGTGPSSKDEIWWDVFPIPSGMNVTVPDPTDPTKTTTINIPGYFKMRSRFVDFAGYYVIHCHILAHEDRGMMTVVEVTPLLPPFSHH
jgi:FtsP/CotA-like multicopper oxidase with cupredoxin domain